MIEEFAKLAPDSLLATSGSIFYSGRAAFDSPSDIYLLGLNPGGSPAAQADQTVKWHTNRVISSMPRNWSAYRDEAWQGDPPGTHGMQPRVLHFLSSLGLEPGEVPSSNVVFVRSGGEDGIAGRFKTLADTCWPLHAEVISQLRIKIVVCFGRRAGSYVCQKLDADHLVNTFIENNKRRWSSCLYSNNGQKHVAVLTHPSRVDWLNPATDPTGLVEGVF